MVLRSYAQFLCLFEDGSFQPLLVYLIFYSIVAVSTCTFRPIESCITYLFLGNCLMELLSVIVLSGLVVLEKGEILTKIIYNIHGSNKDKKTGKNFFR